jgi:hypothetical protein
MWRRPKQPGVEPPISSGEQSKSTRGPRALSSTDELLRRAAWDGLPDTERANLLAAYPSFPSPVGSEVSNSPADIRPRDLQDWVAALVAGSFQAEPAQVV